MRLEDFQGPSSSFNGRLISMDILIVEDENCPRDFVLVIAFVFFFAREKKFVGAKNPRLFFSFAKIRVREREFF